MPAAALLLLPSAGPDPIPRATALAAVLSGQKSSADALKQAQQEMNTLQNR